MRLLRLFVVATAFIASVAPQQVTASHSSRPVTVVKTFPHDPNAFTQGLEFYGTALFEGTGLRGESTLRRVDLKTGSVRRKRSIPDKYFGEGITVVGKRIFQITWQENTAFVYGRRTFKRIRRFTYEGEGWGLAHNSRRLVMSNGSSTIAFRDPRTFEVTRRIDVTDEGQPVDRLNELEWVNGDILANIWQTNDIVRIDPVSGNVTARYDVSALQQREEREGNPDVANGIAYMKEQNRLFVTGKFWRHVYEVELPS